MGRYWWKVCLYKDVVDVNGQHKQSRVEPDACHEHKADTCWPLQVYAVENTAQIQSNVGEVMEPCKDDTNRQDVAKNEARVERQSRNVMEQHLAPVVFLLDEEVANQILHMIPVGEEDVALDAGYLLSHVDLAHHIGDRCVWVSASEEPGQPLSVSHEEPAPVSAHGEVKEANCHVLGLVNLTFAVVFVSLKGHEGIENGVSHAKDE